MDDLTLRVSLRQSAPVKLEVAFTCAPGEVLAVFGPSGSGKSTILRSIAGLHAPREALVQCGGEVWTDTSRDLQLPVHQRRVGFVFQDYALFPHMTARENVEAALGHLPRGNRRDRAGQLLELVHLGLHAERRPEALSGGERQRVALARALARDPQVLLLDEPFSAVDRAVRRRLQDQIAEVRQAVSVPIVLVTHDFDDVVRLATHLLVLDGGASVCQGPLHTLAARPDLPWLREAVGLGSIVETEVAEVHAARRLVTLRFEGGSFVAPHSGLTVGTKVRVRVPAREVILASTPPVGLSLHNALTGTVTAVHAEASSDHVMVQLGVGPTLLLAEVTRDAVAQLGIVPGVTLHALVKAVSLDVQPTKTAPADR